jgi:hypothetical protein
MSARAAIHAMFPLDETATHELDARLDAYRTEVLAEVTNTADTATIYADRPCVCEQVPHFSWCPASVPTDERITEIRRGTGDPLSARELLWLEGAAARHELHVTGARGGHWPLTGDLPGALLLVSQYLAATVAVINRAELAVEGPATFFQPGRTYASGTTRFRCEAISPSPTTGENRALGWKYAQVDAVHHWFATALDPDDWAHGGWTDITDGGGQ